MTSATAAVVNLAAAALAAIATTVLAIFAARQWHVMKENNEAAERQNELVRDHWKREDETRAEENKPKTVLWLNKSQDNARLELCCANLGTTNFLISGMQVDPLQGKSIKILFNEIIPIIVPVGTMRSVSLKDPEKMFGSDNPGNVGIKLILQGLSGETETDVKACRLWFHNGQYMMKDVKCEFQGLETISCPKCETQAANFSVEGMTILPDCRKEIAEVKREFEETCPNHTSSNNRVTFGTDRLYNVLRDTLDV